MPSELARLTRSEWELILGEATFCKIDIEIVRGYLINGMYQVDVGGEVDRDRRTVYNRLHKYIFPRAQEVAHKLNII